ncbi:hypothetical protein CDN99_24175 [Roseateles aquatilis]|uniref:Contractile injection system tube protein N-terminal domain-containing protein n=1 Tax=Roseateles aquatilis TaxID=431061 RepID=A0A246IW45_9BURK|nr:peptidoglycan-binding protein [Roseateles aquatilis]OWQ84396.1 hypothetical protein CDN99_24175 [Roseateles aquatilis]
MAKQPLTLTALQLNKNGPPTPIKGKTYQLMINPSEFSHQRSICYNTRKTMGQTSNPARFAAMNPDSIAFSVIFDGTGVIPSRPDQPSDVTGQIETMCAVVYDYESEDHEPHHLRVAWGTLSFDCRLKSFDTQYTLFKSSGAPLRAKVDLALTGFATYSLANYKANRASPDLSHSVLVVDGDTLPLLCLRIYGDARYYPEVAAFNGLTEFRRLAPGSRLHFPPLS